MNTNQLMKKLGDSFDEYQVTELKEGWGFDGVYIHAELIEKFIDIVHASETNYKRDKEQQLNQQ